MDILIALVVVIAIFLAIVMLILRGLKPSEARDWPVHNLDSHGQHRVSTANPFHAVTVCAMEGACESASKLPQRRYLVDEAPLLPLPECNAGRCNCRYIHHQDRRDLEHERRTSLGVATAIHLSEGGNDRRSQRGRRRADLAMA